MTEKGCLKDPVRWLLNIGQLSEEFQELNRFSGRNIKNCTAKHGLRNDCKQCHKTTKKESYKQKTKCSNDTTPIKGEDHIVFNIIFKLELITIANIDEE